MFLGSCTSLSATCLKLWGTMSSIVVVAGCSSSSLKYLRQPCTYLPLVYVFMFFLVSVTRIQIYVRMSSAVFLLMVLLLFDSLMVVVVVVV